VAKLYGINPETIIDANPGLSSASFAIGKIIRIPTGAKPPKQNAEVVETQSGAKEIYYTVPDGETLYSLCRKFNTTDTEIMRLNPELSGGLRKGMTLRIPLKIKEKDIPKDPEPDPKAVNQMLEAKEKPKPVRSAKIALLLPYDAGKKNTSAAPNRFTEYYEGLLLAVDSLRRKGLSAELFVYDTGDNTAELNRTLQEKKDILENVNLIIGGISNDQIKMLADFALKRKIKYVIPFTSKNDEVLNNAYIFQVNTPQTYLSANASTAAANLFSKDNIVFIDTKDPDPQTDFLKEFKAALKDRKVTYKDGGYNEATFETTLLSLLSKDKPNVVIPVSSSLEALNKIKTVLRSVKSTKPEYAITLFGYPIWQTYYKECLDDFHDLNTYIYSLFYADNVNPTVKSFYNNYKNWYSKNPTSSFPIYAMLGFDTGMFFFGAIQKYGENFENNLSKIKYSSLQTGFNFERVNNWGGFINTNIYLVHFNSDYTISRLDYK